MHTQELVDQIISGQYINIYYLSGETRALLIQKLANYPDNANGLFYSGLLQCDENKGIPYYKKAVKLGSLAAMVVLGRYYNTITEKRTKGIKYGLKVINSGFVIPSFLTWEIKYCASLKDAGFQYLIEEYFKLKSQNKQLTKKVSQLECELTEERLRPPEHGGSEYEKINAHFLELCNR